MRGDVRLSNLAKMGARLKLPIVARPSPSHPVLVLLGISRFPKVGILVVGRLMIEVADFERPGRSLS